MISDIEKAVDRIAKEHYEGTLPNHHVDPNCDTCAAIANARYAIGSHEEEEDRSIRVVIGEILPLIPVDTPNEDDDFTELKGELESCGGEWFSAPEIEMPLWLGVATSLESWLDRPARDWPEWKWQVLAVFSGQSEATLRASLPDEVPE